MALQAYVGDFTINNATGTQEVNPSGLTFTPTGVIFFGGGLHTAGGNLDDMSFFMGAAVSSSNRWAAGSWSDDNAATSSCNGYVINTRCILFAHNAAPSVEFVSLDSDGFTVNVIAGGIPNILANFILLGGDVTAMEPFVHNLGSGSGTKSKTGLAGSPKAVIFFAGVGVTTDTSADGAASGSTMVGWMCADGTQAYAQTRHTHGAAAADTITRLRVDKCCGIFNTTSEVYEGEFVSMDANGFTINLDNTPTANARTHGVAIYGGEWTSVAINSPTGTGEFDISTPGVDPAVAFFLTRGLVAGTTSTPGGQRGFGVASSGTRRATVAYVDTDAADPTESLTRLDRSKCLVIGDSMAGGTLVIDDEYDFVSHGTEEIRLDHTVASGTAIHLAVLVGGVTSSPGAPDAEELIPARIVISVP